MININKYIIEKLHLNKDLKVNKENYVIANSLDELKDWVHNEWDGKSSFFVSKKFSFEDIKELIDYMYELDRNAEVFGADYWEDADEDNKLWKINVDLDG